MASCGGHGHGGKRINSGRKRKVEDTREYTKAWQRNHKRIYLEERTFELRLQAKFDAGFKSFSDSDFATHLLCLEHRRRKIEDILSVSKVAFGEQKKHLPSAIDDSEGPQTSTPVKPRRELSESLGISPIAETVSTPDNCAPPHPSFIENSRLHSSLGKSNCSMFSDDEGSDEELDDKCSVENESFRKLCDSAIREMNDDKFLEGADSDSDVSIMYYNGNADLTDGEDDELLPLDTDDDGTDDDEEENQAVADQDNQAVGDQENQTHATTTAASMEEEDRPELGPHRKLSRGEDLFEFRKEVKMVTEKKFICSLELFLNLFVACCRTPGCDKVPEVKHHFVGATVVITAKCQAGHLFRFASSREVNGLYANNLQIAAATLLSGNNFGKVNRLADFLGLSFLSESTFYRMQRLYLFPAVEEWWSWMQGELLKEFSDEKVVVGGDGQCDSPGFTAKNLCYFLMELTTGYILEIEVRDKRHVGLASTNMEKVALQNALTRLKRVLNVVEVATDASSSIKKLIANEFKDVFHSLDVWHKSKSIRKCLAKIGQAKAMAKIKAWSDHIIRHFWYCAKVCKENENSSDEEALQIMKSKWIGLLHHICGSHEWLDGRCDHGDQIHDDNLTWFDRRDADFAELQKVILNPELLDSFRFYVRFRHTGRIECANSLTLAYTPKRTPLSYRAYKVRKYIATFDWNFHLDIPSAISKSGNEITSRRYNQRTKQWDVRTVKQNKTFDYIPLLTARMLRARVNDSDLVARKVSMNESDPRLVAPTIAAKPPPSSKEMLERKSRFIAPSKYAKSTSGQDLGEILSNEI